MKLIYEPSVETKIQKMKERICFNHPLITQRNIDQTSMLLDDGNQDNPEFSFMVIGDSGTKPSYNSLHKSEITPQRRVAQLMLPHQEDCSFVLHTGDVIYVVGSREYYQQSFIEPYREFLEGGESPQNIKCDRMIFKKPILPVLGNHDYYDVPWMYRLIAGSTQSLRRFFRYRDIEIGWHGSNQGDAYAKAFMDYLAAIPSQKHLENHLDSFYTAKTDTGRCLRYEPGFFTRVPNRYYTFCYGGIDFFALDSNTFKNPPPLPTTKKGEIKRQELEKYHHEIVLEEMQILAACQQQNPKIPAEAAKLDVLKARLNQIDEVKLDIEAQLTAQENTPVDFEQLNWLKQRLIASWNNPNVRGRIIYFHHPPYVTEGSKWHQSQTLAVRRRLRHVFDGVAETLGSQLAGKPIVNLILNGHAHCLEYLQTTNTGHADSHLHCIVSGGSGHRPRRQRREGNELMETFNRNSESFNHKVADSHLFVGRTNYGEHECLPYSFVRIDVKAGNSPKFIVRPFASQWYQNKWQDISLQPFEC
jgi:Calcineurin-like phosphoesterase